MSGDYFFLPLLAKAFILLSNFSTVVLRVVMLLLRFSSTLFKSFFVVSKSFLRDVCNVSYSFLDFEKSQAEKRRNKVNVKITDNYQKQTKLVINVSVNRTANVNSTNAVGKTLLMSGTNTSQRHKYFVCSNFFLIQCHH